VFAFASLKPRRTRFNSVAVATRSPRGKNWWARQDSNLQPDRYERPALTIELQAPPETAAKRGRATVRLTPYNAPADPAMPDGSPFQINFGFSELTLTAG
jgi:hypothetical protein